VGPLPEAVGLPVPDAVPTPESGGCGVGSASWDRGHNSSQVRAENGAGQQPRTWNAASAERGGKVSWTSPKQAGASHTHVGRRPALQRPSGRGGGGGSQPVSTHPEIGYSACKKQKSSG
jgi:hypothetical protein